MKKLKKFFRWSSRKAFGAWKIYWNLSTASAGHDVGRYLDRKNTTPRRRFMWRVALSSVLILNTIVLWPFVFIGLWIIGVMLPFAVAGLFLYGSFHEIWRN